MRNWGKKGGICVILKNIVMGCSSGVLIFRILTYFEVECVCNVILLKTRLTT